MNDQQLPASPGKRRRLRNILALAAAVVVVGALTGIATIALLRNGTLSSQVTAANARAANAVTAAQAAAKSDYAARNAALNREAARLKRQNQDVAAKIGELRANSIRAHGKYVVGHDIKSGTWHPSATAASAVVSALTSSSAAPASPAFRTSLMAPGRSTCPAPPPSRSKAPARGCVCHRPSRRFSSRTYPQLAQIVRALRAVGRRCR